MFRKKCVWVVTLLLCLFVFTLLAIPGCASAAAKPKAAHAKAAHAKAAHAKGLPAKAAPAKAEGVFKVLDPISVAVPTEDAATPPAKRLSTLSGKKVWLIVVDEGYGLVPAVGKLLPKYAPGVQVKMIRAAEKGNPFFMLKPADQPDAVIAGVGICEATTPEAMNYAKQAEQRKIPAVIVFKREGLLTYVTAMKKVNAPNVRAYATDYPALIPPGDKARPGEPERLANRLIPLLIDGLTQPVGADRQRIGFTGSEDKAKAAFERQQWTDGEPVVLPTEERVAAMLKGTGSAPEDVVGFMAPGMRQVTVEKVAINAVMAGCTPEQMPFALGLADLLCRKKIGNDLGTYEPPILHILLGGQEIERINASKLFMENPLGRLARLMLINLGGIPRPAFEGTRIWPTLAEWCNKSDASTVTLLDGGKGEIWKQSTTFIYKWW